ncbi:kinase-like domain-containing protein [Absidia repens]|uniref:non-specific serine/threonine protein kinase n=1 Tax=Absidia repens TaxID=90262 RepID=A0A1X2I4J1_9FUNG|nr:kinase-like domain-containing protein [Absidia repens]
MVVPYMLEEWQREEDFVTKDEHNTIKAVGKYVLKQTLGKGSMGKVKLGIHVVTGEKAAIKIVPRTTRNRKLTAKELSRELRAIREGHFMMLLDHPHIVYLRAMIAGSHYYYFLMDYVNGGQLLHYIVKRTHLSEKHSRHFCRQMVSALDYMHRNSVVHRDLKIENILVDRTGRNIKIIDFGLSNLFCPERQLTTYCGSLYFAAPELLNGRPYRGPEIDVWSLGVVLYVMVTGSVPFDDKSLPGLHEKIKHAQVDYPAYVSNQCHHLLSHILIAEPQQRITLADIIRHPWLNEGRSGYTRNYLLFREPLSLPLDEKILGKMTYGFNLGTVNDIRMKMEVILKSSVYRVSAAHVSDIQSLALENQQCYRNSHLKSQHRLTNTGSDRLKSINKAANRLIWGTYNDPQSVPAAYHPLLSLYYLTMERMKRIENLDSGKSTMESSSSKTLHPQKSTNPSEPSLPFLEHSKDTRSKQLAPSPQPNNHRHQSHSWHEPSANRTKENQDSIRRHCRYSADSTYHPSQIQVDHHLPQHCDPSIDMLPPTLFDTPTERTNPRRHVYSSTNSTSTLPSLSAMQSIYQSPSSSLSYSFLVLCPSKSLPSASSTPTMQTKQSINPVSRIHLLQQNPISTPKATIPTTTTTTTTTESTPLSSSSSLSLSLPSSSLLPSPSSKRKKQFLTKLGALLRLRKGRHQHLPLPSEHQQRHRRCHYLRHHHRRNRGSMPCNNNNKTTTDATRSHSDAVFTETSTYAAELPLIPSPTLHFQYDLYDQQQPILTPNNSSSLSNTIDGTCPLSENVVIVSSNIKLKDTNLHGGSSVSVSYTIEKLPDICGNKRTTGWLESRLRAWMDRAPILNRFTF